MIQIAKSRSHASIHIGNHVDEQEALNTINHTTNKFAEISQRRGCWNGVDLELFLCSHGQEVSAVPTSVTKAIVALFWTVASARKQFSSPRSNDRLFLEIGLINRDDANFRNILETAIDILTLRDLKLNDYGSFCPSDSIGYSASCRIQARHQHRGPSLWDHIKSSDSLENIDISIQWPENYVIHAKQSPSKTIHGLPQLWEAITCNRSMTSLGLHVYGSVVEPLMNEDPTTALQRLEAELAMESLSESLNNHPSIRKLEIRYRRDSHPGTLLIPSVANILEHSNLQELKLERFSFHVSFVRIAFPVEEFIEALLKNTARKGQQQRQPLEVLRLCNVGLIDFQANKLLRCLPDHIRVLDLSKNKIETFPKSHNNHNCSRLQELSLWKNQCLYNTRERELSLECLLSLLKTYPCLRDFGPWDKWQTQITIPSRAQPLHYWPRGHMGYIVADEDEEDDQEDDDEYQNACEQLVKMMEWIADQNRCKIRLLPRKQVLDANPSYWPLLLCIQLDSITFHERKLCRGKRLIGESSKPGTERQADVIFSILRENGSSIINSAASHRLDESRNSI